MDLPTWNTQVRTVIPNPIPVVADLISINQRARPQNESRMIPFSKSKRKIAAQTLQFAAAFLPLMVRLKKLPRLKQIAMNLGGDCEKTRDIFADDSVFCRPVCDARESCSKHPCYNRTR
jgi:hypothetical protein